MRRPGEGERKDPQATWNGSELAPDAAAISGMIRRDD